MSVRIVISALALALLPLASSSLAQAQDSAEKAKAVTEEGGKNFDAEGNPTYKIENGTVDWYTFSGYRRYHSDCHVCHGPDGTGSSYAPALVNSLKTMDYATFISIVAEGRKNVGGGKENVMPAFGDNKNVYCYMDDLYVYLRARADGAAPRGRPPKKADKPQAAKDAEASCMGG
ncbi:MAG: c-type cytochrome, methanol metabolism-related [Mesorhizobium sp.]|jgi:methanol metabolism-related c-type cytochrome|uniref:c-type cytochrome, methanol metabolism-related n=1 Tax=Mesorhizobium sp. TaxID=1871066 RepID=UPI000FE5986D|nr:c-type cytochrome, methanol metabolism-related [Mesorhizobium sp.]RWM17435.1 MAG: c-type cytochrome, methanol metabolism-related [Mesorhizobium sp.]TIP73434.1 MAG: c-type cytochrome, methanol metabolism-related [Mesorhizobium sp.]TIQ12110.1 MAG: c-type cytochrome, methanol metabolism-related [Mesorhizobium sp.]TIR51468.1 MAG: c-type cytochrome, methanol metabolism-related [Mesorhizobium sp.]TJV97014.1 MAG: c-type cytochrome, methanol metabolism-related [Mesorhizobium sp.]